MAPVIAHQGPFRWKAAELFKLFLYCGVMVVGFLTLDNNIWDADRGQWILVMAYLGIWRYVWWLTHFVRAVLYGKLVFPRLRARANALWDQGWRPEELVFMMTTFYEERVVTEKVILSIIYEAQRVGVPTRIFVGSGAAIDEKIIQQSVKRFGKDMDIEVIFVRQNQPGKRMAIGLALRAISRKKVASNTPIMFIDGDTILAPNCLKNCLPLLALRPNMHAMTTDEQPILYGPKCLRRWFDLRFAQRHMVLQS
ncbi:MAG: glycosyltransferase, partial [Humidesulfovibrio sp.]|nr:glycosyltransferase [Humidesulfovibrio sp.]